MYALLIITFLLHNKDSTIICTIQEYSTNKRMLYNILIKIDREPHKKNRPIFTDRAGKLIKLIMKKKVTYPISFCL